MNKLALVCDDLRSDRMVLSEILRKLGFEIIEAINGSEAIEMATSKKPDIIFMDIVMPDINGFQAIRQILKNKETCDIPIIVVSTKDRGPDIMNSKANGAKSHICKPININKVKEELKKLKF